MHYADEKYNELLDKVVTSLRNIDRDEFIKNRDALMNYIGSLEISDGSKGLLAQNAVAVTQKVWRDVMSNLNKLTDEQLARVVITTVALNSNFLARTKAEEKKEEKPEEEPDEPFEYDRKQKEELDRLMFPTLSMKYNEQKN